MFCYFLVAFKASRMFVVLKFRFKLKNEKQVSYINYMVTRMALHRVHTSAKVLFLPTYQPA